MPDPRSPQVSVTGTVKPAPWYLDTRGGVLVGGGVLGGVIGLLAYRSALVDLDEANADPSYQRQTDLYASARTKRVYAVVFGVGGLALVTAGVIHFRLHSRRTRAQDLGLAVTTSGGIAVWSGRF